MSAEDPVSVVLPFRPSSCCAPPPAEERQERDQHDASAFAAGAVVALRAVAGLLRRSELARACLKVAREVYPDRGSDQAIELLAASLERRARGE